jgi:hypothetical protein
LADIYVALELPAQERLGAAVEAFHQRLSREPFGQGESREGEIRLAFVDCLAITFLVDVDSQVVRVTKIKRYGR